jgi:FixJ family two-component response regulator
MINDAPIVLVVDDDPSVCSSLRRLLHGAGYQVRTFSSTRQLFAHGRPDGPCCLILDVRMPGGDGLSFLDQLNRAGIHVPTIFISGFGDVPTTVRAIKAGAMDFLLKPYEPAVLLSAVRTCLESDARSLSGEHRLAEVRARYEILTPREREVFVAVASGMLNKQIAFDLGISEKTVKVHRARVMEKMAAEVPADLVRMADLLCLPCSRTPGTRANSMTSGVS